MHQKDLKDLFIPSEDNKFKPIFLERFSMGVMLALVLLSFAMANIQALVWISSDRLVSTVLPAVIVELTNEERTGEQLAVLRRNTVLDSAAQLKADDMAKNAYFAHYSPEGLSPWYWFDQVSYSFIHAGENLAVHFTDSGDVVEAWMDSPTHRANIMNGNYTEIGVGTAKGTYKGVPTIFVVQLFGTPSTGALVTEEIIRPSAPVVALAQNGTSSNVAGETTVNNNVLAEEISTIEQNEASSTPADVALASTTEMLRAEETASSTEVIAQDIQVEEEKVLYSDFASTSRPGVPAVLTQDGTGSQTPLSLGVLDRTATQPNIWLQMVYILLAVMVTIALILSIVIEWRKQNPIQIAYAGGLLVIMAFLLHVHVLLTSGVTIA